jgi:molybdopterin-guanine dinucleotide biosynthesis protein A
MGRDKALVPFLGRPLILRILDRVAPLADEIVVTTNHPENFSFLNHALVPDIMPGLGALGGLLTALSSASHPMVAVVACDMPFVNPCLLLAQKVILDISGVDVVIPRLETGYETFHAIYRRDTCLTAVREAIQNGQRRMIDWLPGVKVKALGEEDIRAMDPGLQSFINVNTEEELKRAEEIAKVLDGG